MNSTRTAFGTAAVALAITLTGCSAETGAIDSAPAEDDPSSSSSATPSAVATDAPSSSYRDGEYSATGWYGSLPSHHDVTLTILSDTVTAVEITTPAENDTSLGYQQRLAEALPEAVIGRNIDELDVDRLAGSSGSSEGFMDALAQIKAEAIA
jgi:uncharacterized protein with FMN-binding domain